MPTKLTLPKTRKKAAEHQAANEDFSVISLFSGAMGLDLGLHEAGLHVAVAQDIDPWCAATIRDNMKRKHVSCEVIEGDIKQLVSQDPTCSFLLNASKRRRGEVFAVVGGPPCQAFSTAGKRQGVNDVRGTLFGEFVQAVEAIQPRFFVMENVKGLTSMHIDPNDEGSPLLLDLILNEFKRIGYHITHSLLDAVHYGTPQFRERVVIIGSRDNERLFLPVPTHFQMHQKPEHRWKTLKDTIEEFEANPGPHDRFTPRIQKYLELVPEGGNWKSLPADVVEEAMGGAFRSGGGKVGFFRRLAYSQPSPTLVTSPIQKATLLCHPKFTRPLSVKEYAAIQQFPRWWKIKGNATECYRQIGNAVPIPLGRAIGATLLAIAAGDAEVVSKRLRGTSIHRKILAIQNGTAHEPNN